MNRFLGVIILIILLSFQSFAFQNEFCECWAGFEHGWCWGSDPREAKEHNVLYVDALKLKDYETAVYHVEWLLKNTPCLNKSLYINGGKIYDQLTRIEKDTVVKIQLIKRAIEIYELGLKYFKDNHGARRNNESRKYMLAFLGGERSDQELYNLYKEIIELNGNNIKSYALASYLVLTSKVYSEESITYAQALKSYKQISKIIKIKFGNAELEESNRLKRLFTVVNDKFNKVHPKYTVQLPENYNPTKKYPLFIALHGGNGNKDELQKRWQSEKLKTDYIVVYMEATTKDMREGRFGWRNVAEERNNIAKYYKEILEVYSIDTHHVYMGGFSLGAKMSVDMAMSYLIPVRGVFSFCIGGGFSDTFNKENILKAKERGITFYIISGSKDFHYKQQSVKLSSTLGRYGVMVNYNLVRNMGHVIPNVFDELMDEALSYLTK